MSAANKRKKCQLEMQKPFLASAHVLFRKSPIHHEQLETLEFHLVTPQHSYKRTLFKNNDKHITHDCAYKDAENH